jgi:hypothetical protein
MKIAWIHDQRFSIFLAIAGRPAGSQIEGMDER